MGKRRFPEYVLEEHARQLYHDHEWVGADVDPPDHVPQSVRHLYRAARCVRCDEVRWVRNYTDNNDTESE